MKKQKKDKEQKEHKKPWREVYATVEDIQNFLMDRVLLRHNVITRRVECREPSGDVTDGTPWQPISDRIVNSLWAELSATKAVRAQDMYRVIESDFVPEYNPFTFYLVHLPPWDGRDDYILELSLSVCVRGDEQTQWQFYEYLRKWLEVELVHLYFRKPVGVESGEFMSVARALQPKGNYSISMIIRR